MRGNKNRFVIVGRSPVASICIGRPADRSVPRVRHTPNATDQTSNFAPAAIWSLDNKQQPNDIQQTDDDRPHQEVKGEWITALW